jgi:hypothetical protein
MVEVAEECDSYAALLSGSNEHMWFGAHVAAPIADDEYQEFEDSVVALARWKILKTLPTLQRVEPWV